MSHNSESKKAAKLESVEVAKASLAAKFCDVEPGPDDWSLDVITPEGRRFYFWPYSGWFSELKGQGQGRGMANMLRCSKGEKQKNKFGKDK